MLFTADRNHHLVQMPFIANWWAVLPDRFSILTIEFHHPKSDGFMADNDPAFGQQVLNISQAQAETEV